MVECWSCDWEAMGLILDRVKKRCYITVPDASLLSAMHISIGLAFLLSYPIKTLDRFQLERVVKE